MDNEMQTELEQEDEEVQTELPGKKLNEYDEEEEPEEEQKVDEEHLASWLESIFPRLSDMLNQNSASRAFDNYEVQWTDERTSNDLLYVL